MKWNCSIKKREANDDDDDDENDEKVIRNQTIEQKIKRRCSDGWLAEG